jgi:hypothetical protein
MESVLVMKHPIIINSLGKTERYDSFGFGIYTQIQFAASHNKPDHIQMSYSSYNRLRQLFGKQSALGQMVSTASKPPTTKKTKKKSYVPRHKAYKLGMK